ncbi:hypothetical protein HPB47_014423 [Ixodes persulcatus]|uniref:Uncharacterized protein n=1 Tax=Ixodes persulcatus TaxID=34615 RepID=A0AC60QW55_IXOPE|nr:hypothetical protein HPB47_014423 [Ixodes persulcatus]
MEEMFLLTSEPPRRDVHQPDDDVFRAMFRFRREQFSGLLSGLRIPDKITSAQGIAVTSDEALGIALRHLAYHSRRIDLEVLFGRCPSVLSSIAAKVYRHIDETSAILLSDPNAHRWLDVAELEHVPWWITMIMNSSTKEERKNLAISKNGDLNWTVTEREEGFIAQSKTSKYEEITFVPGYVLLSESLKSPQS